jgi:hypothetical protein
MERCAEVTRVLAENGQLSRDQGKVIGSVRLP